jgi:hypothetical protein
MADAVLGTGSILRDEPNTKFVPGYPDLIEARKTILKKKTK